MELLDEIKVWKLSCLPFWGLLRNCEVCAVRNIEEQGGQSLNFKVKEVKKVQPNLRGGGVVRG